MRVLVLPSVAELGDRARLAVGDEHRVVAEAFRAARRVGDPTLEHARPAYLASVGCERDELRDIARAPVADTLELAEELGDRGCALGGVARRVQTGASGERMHLDARVLADRPALCVGERAAELRFRAGVLDVRLAGLVGPAIGVERLDRPSGKQELELARLVGIARRKDG